MSTSLTKNFTLEELNPLGLTLTKKLRENLLLLATELEIVRKDLGNRPITVVSGYRSKAVELKHGRDGRSRHVLGEAADIQVAGLNPKMVQRALFGWLGGMGYGEDFTHLDVRHLSTSRPTSQRRARWDY